MTHVAEHLGNQPLEALQDLHLEGVRGHGCVGVRGRSRQAIEVIVDQGAQGTAGSSFAVGVGTDLCQEL